jgi:uncharacterized membrane protein HdeD (DUF308 family)
MSTQGLTSDIKKRSTWGIVMGVLTAILGVFLIAYPLATAAITTIVIGTILIIAAVAHVVFALHSHSAGRFFLKLLLAVLYGIVGLSLVFNPLIGVATLTVFLGSLLMVYGIVAAVTAFQMRPVDGWGWFLVDAIVTVLIGVLILSRWPTSSLWAIGTLVGVSVLMSGISRIMIASKIRGAAARVEDFTRRAA